MSVEDWLANGPRLVGLSSSTSSQIPTGQPLAGSSLNNRPSYCNSTTTSDGTSSPPSNYSSRSSAPQSLGSTQSLIARSVSRRCHDGWLPCLFSEHNCNIYFRDDDFENWYSHNLSHFLGNSPPDQSICIFCDTTFGNDEDKWSAWYERMHHIYSHFKEGLSIVNSRPDFAVLRYLRAINLIDQDTFTRAQGLTERAWVDGLKPFDWIPEEWIAKRDREQNEYNKAVFSLEREDRNRRRHLRRGPGLQQAVRKEVLLCDHTNATADSTQQCEPTCDPKQKRITHIQAKQDEAEPFLREPGFLFAESDTLSDDDSESSFNHSNLRECMRDILPPDLDRDEDLVEPTGHKQLLRDIRVRVSQNSVALQYGQKVNLILDSPSKDESKSPMYSECCHILMQIRENIRMLQDCGYCHERLSFITLDLRRRNVALLRSIPVESIIDLCAAFAAGKIVETPTPVVGNQDTKYPEAAIVRHPSKESANSGLRNPLDTVSHLVRPMNDLESIVGNNHVRVTKHSTDRNPRFENECSISSVNIQPGTEYENSTRRTYFRVPDVGKFQPFSVARGSVVVHNHFQRRAHPDEPRASTCNGDKRFQLGIYRRVRNQAARESRSGWRLLLPDKYLDETPLWNAFAEACKVVLKPLSMNFDKENAVSRVYFSMLMLDLIILSYSGAHVENVHDSLSTSRSSRSFFKIAGSKICREKNPCPPQKGAVTLAYRKLRCLDGFLVGRSVWVFHGEDIDPRDKTPLFLSASPDDLADLWGPLWKISVPNRPTEAQRYDFEHGSIILSESNEHAQQNSFELNSDEELCHWISDSDIRVREASLSALCQKPITKPRMLIGAKEGLRLKHNTNCLCKPSRITKELENANLLRPLGTSKDKRHIDSEAVSVGLSGAMAPVQANYSISTKMILGRTFKESLRKRWSHDKTHRNPYVLLEYRAAEMSFCTQNCRRIRIVDLLATKTISLLIRDVDPIKNEDCKAAVTEALKIDTHSHRVNPMLLVNLYINKPEWREDIANLVICCLDALSDTGIRQGAKEPLSLFWMFDHKEYILRFPQECHRWSGFIKDSDDCCSFVVLEENCLTFPLGRECQHKPRRGASSGTGKECEPLFETALIVNEEVNEPSGLKLVRHKKPGRRRRWKVNEVAKGSSFPMGDQGSLVVLKVLASSDILVKWIPKNPFKTVLRDVLALVAQKDAELHHREAIADITEEEDAPVRVFIIA